METRPSSPPFVPLLFIQTPGSPLLLVAVNQGDLINVPATERRNTRQPFTPFGASRLFNNRGIEAEEEIGKRKERERDRENRRKERKVFRSTVVGT